MRGHRSAYLSVALMKVRVLFPLMTVLIISSHNKISALKPLPKTCRTVLGEVPLGCSWFMASNSASADMLVYTSLTLPSYHTFHQEKEIFLGANLSSWPNSEESWWTADWCFIAALQKWGGVQGVLQGWALLLPSLASVATARRYRGWWLPLSFPRWYAIFIPELQPKWNEYQWQHWYLRPWKHLLSECL